MISIDSINFICFQALNIDFECLAAAEIDENYRDVISLNHPSRVKHIYTSIEEMLEDKGFKVCGGPSLGVTGSPCNPFSTKRNKRFADGSIVDHRMSTTTFDCVTNWYSKFEPRTGITEQVRGFVMRISSSTPETPCDRRNAGTGRSDCFLGMKHRGKSCKP